jgi:hypothetical protein
MRPLIALLALLASAIPCAGQTFTAATDRPAYAPGEPIELRATLRNDTGEALPLFFGSITAACQVTFHLGAHASTDLAVGCLAAIDQVSLPAGAGITWFVELDPELQALPIDEGVQTVHARLHAMVRTASGSLISLAMASDTVYIDAPAPVGGRLSVSFAADRGEEVAVVRDSLSAEVLSSAAYGENVYETWRVAGHFVDAVAARYRDDSRFIWFKPLRDYRIARRAARDDEGRLTGATAVGPEAVPVTVRLEGNYPNPFNPSTTVRFMLERPAHVGVEVYDALGRRVAVVAARPFVGGTWHEVEIDASHLPSGTYVYRLVGVGRDVPGTGRMVLLK